jgi:hypothetical protein
MKALKVLAPIALLALAILFVVTPYIHYKNFGNQQDNLVRAEYQNMENILAQYSLQVGEAAQIPSMQAEDLSRIFTNTLDARYGSNGSQATFQWLQEQNPALDQATYANIQNIISAGRNRFENAQTRFIDVKRLYENAIGNVWSGFWLGVAGYPKINLSEFVIISSGHAQQSFADGVDPGIQLR